MTREELLLAVKEAVQAVSPGASVILFGSRARGDAQPDSDWDFLVLTDEPLGWRKERELLRGMWRVEWQCGEVLNPIVHSRAEWQSPIREGSPFLQAVNREGIPV